MYSPCKVYKALFFVGEIQLCKRNYDNIIVKTIIASQKTNKEDIIHVLLQQHLL